MERSQPGAACGYDYTIQTFHPPCDANLLCVNKVCTDFGGFSLGTYTPSEHDSSKELSVDEANSVVPKGKREIYHEGQDPFVKLE